MLFTPDEVLASKIGSELKALLIKKWEEKHKTKFDAKQIKFQERLELLRKQESIQNPIREAALRELFSWTPKAVEETQQKEQTHTE